MRLVEEEDELRLVEIAHLRELLEQLGEHPHQHCREEARLLLHGGELEEGDHAASVRRGAEQVADLELRLAEELRSAPVLELHERAEQDADRLLRHAADPCEVFLALLRLEEREQRAKVGEVDEREPTFVRVTEDEGEARLLCLVRAEHLREQLRPEVGDACANGRAGADPAQRQELGRVGRRLVCEPEVGHPLGGLAFRGAGDAESRDVALVVRGEDRDSGL